MINFETKDINMLASIINLKLRDNFSSLNDFLKYYDLEKEVIEEKMNDDFYYCEKLNQFKRK